MYKGTLCEAEKVIVFFLFFIFLQYLNLRWPFGTNKVALALANPEGITADGFKAGFLVGSF